MPEDLRLSALDYHRHPRPGKTEIQPTKSLTNQRELALAYSPGVAAACEAIVADAGQAWELTNRCNLVAVVTNGTAVLGLGSIGPLAAKPVMEGKSVLFKKFAGIDAFDIELTERDIDRFVDIVAALEPTFGAINLEDIKAPECFEIERKLQERMGIPVFHDDQHGTAIIVAAAILNGLRVVGKDMASVKLVTSGAGAAALACLNMLVSMGLPRENIVATDIAGVVYAGRSELMDPWKAQFARDIPDRTLAEAICGADVFLGLSAGGVLKPDMVAQMAERPLILALANPAPEILPEDARAVRPDAILCTGRSDYPNQVNNVLCFPFIFRGALDVGATTINQEMRIACAHAIADLAMAEQSDIVAMAYGDQQLAFGPDYLIPKPFDPRLILVIAEAVARAAMDSGVATRPIRDMPAYHERLQQYIYHSGLVMKPVIAKAKQSPGRIVYCEGEEERVLRAVQVVVDEKLAHPILVGRPEVMEMRIQRLGLRLKEGRDFELVNPDNDPRYKDYCNRYQEIMGRRGVTPDWAKREVRQRTTLIGSLLVMQGEADGLLCGTIGPHQWHQYYLLNVIGLRQGVKNPAAMNMLLHPRGTFFICDTYINYDPSPEQIAEFTLLAAETVQKFGMTPKVALLSHSNFGSHENNPSARKMHAVLDLLRQQAPSLEVDGEMHGDAALLEEIRDSVYPGSTLRGRANLLVMPTLDAANISYNLIKALGDGVTVGPIMLGVAKPAHILTPSATVRRIVNMTALTVVEAQIRSD